MSKLLFWLLGTAIYPLLVYVIVPFFVSRMDMGSTDAAGAGMARGFAFIYGCIIWSVVLFFAEMLLEWLLFHSVWRTLVCAVAGAFLVWALQAGDEYLKNNSRQEFTKYYDTGEVEQTGKYIGTSSDLHGKITTYYKNGNIKSIETYKRDRLAGDCQLFYEDGSLKAKGRLFSANGEELRDGTWCYYDESGALDDERIFEMGEFLSSQNYTLFFNADGLACTISDKKPYAGKLDKMGIIRIESLFPNLFSCEMVDGEVKQGPVEEYYKFGKRIVLAGTYAYVDGQLNGEKRSYHPNSQLKSLCTYSKGKIEGEYVAYYADSVASHPNQTISYSCPYVNDERNGVARWYRRDGRLDSEQPHRHGLRAGVTVRYYYKPDFEEQVIQELYVNDETLKDLVISADEHWDRSKIDFYLEDSDPGFVADFESWRKVDPSWLVMDRVIKADTVICHLNVGAKWDACYDVLRRKVIPGGMSLPEQLPEEDQPLSVTLPSGCGRAELLGEGFHQMKITVVNSDQTTIYDMSNAGNGGWLHVTTIKK